MKGNYCLLAVEGHHDQAAIGKMLKLFRFERFDGTYDDNFDDFWKGFIPTYPKKGGNLYTRVAMPSIFTSQTHSVRSPGSELKKSLYPIEGSALYIHNALPSTPF